MNILFLSLFPIEPGAGGIQRVTDILAKEFVRRGHKVIFLSVQYDLIINGKIETAPQYYIYVNKDKDWEFKIEKLISDNKITHVINQVPTSITNKVLNSISQDVVKISVYHLQPFFNDNISRRQILASDTPNFKLLLFKYISYIFPKFREIIFGRVEKKLILDTISVSDKLCFISELFFPRIIRHIPDIDRSKLYAINNPNPFPVLLEVPEKENLIVWVGRVNNSLKNTIDFVKIWQILQPYALGWKALIVGDGVDLEYIKSYISDNKLLGIETIGQIHNVQEIYRRAKFVIVTSFSESWCMVLTEGMAYGCVPCAYNNYETVHDIIDNGMNGLISSANPKSMSDLLLPLIKDDKKRFVMSQNAMIKVSKYDIRTIADQWEKLLKS